jgi:hypothetical protein
VSKDSRAVSVIEMFLLRPQAPDKKKPALPFGEKKDPKGSPYYPFYLSESQREVTV